MGGSRAELTRPGCEKCPSSSSAPAPLQRHGGDKGGGVGAQGPFQLRDSLIPSYCLLSGGIFPSRQWLFPLQCLSLHLKPEKRLAPPVSKSAFHPQCGCGGFPYRPSQGRGGEQVFISCFLSPLTSNYFPGGVYIIQGVGRGE